MSIAVPVIDYKALVQDDRIHVSLYTDPRIFADEMDRIFTRGWVFVGHASEIPRPGDYVTRTLGTQPVIMVRGKDSAVSVLVNRCMHRGTMLCTAGRGATRTFACPYHGWTYDLDGALLGVPYPGGYTDFDKSAHGLRHAARVDSYRGFVFASFSPIGISLAEHLGRATKLIDRSCDLSPKGEIELSAGWVKHRAAANWKALPENDSDGYHLGFVHLSLFKTVPQSQYQRVVGEEKAIKAVVRDWGNGHLEIDWSPGYQRPFEWFGNASGPAVERFVAALDRRDGSEIARRRIMEGPAHALIFPNLFLGETNIAIERQAATEFVYREARLADEARYAEWHALWADDAVYWVPATTDPAADPEKHLSHIYDNRARLDTRIKLLQTGHRYSQEPASAMRRVISNVEIEQAEDGELVVSANFILAELSVQAKHEMHWWVGRTTHRLRRVDGVLKMRHKK